MTHANIENVFAKLQRKALDSHDKKALWANIEAQLGVFSSPWPVHQRPLRRAVVSIVASVGAALTFTAIAVAVLHFNSEATSQGAQHETKGTSTKTTHYTQHSVITGNSLPAQSPTIPKVQQKDTHNFYDWFGDPGLQNAAKSGYATSFTHSETDNGITVTIRDVIYDEGRLAFRWVSKGKGAGGFGFGPNGIHLSVNGQPYKNNSFEGSGEGRYYGPNHANGVIEISPSKPLPQRFVLGITDYAVGNVRGHWKFRIPVSRIKSDAATKTYELNRSKTYNQVTVRLDKISVTPATVVIDCRVTTPTNHIAPMNLGLLDQKGQIFPGLLAQYLRSQSSGHMTTMQYRYLYPSLGSRVKQITIAPYDIKHPQRNSELKEKLGIPVNLSTVR